MLLRKPFLLAAFLVLVASVPATAQAPLDPEVEKHLRTGQELLAAGDFKKAIRSFKKADKKAEGSCLLCQVGLVRAYNGAGDSKDALESVETLLSLTDDDQIVGFAHNARGLALLAIADSDPEILRDAVTSFHRAVELTGAEISRFNLGLTLLLLEEDDEGVAVLEKLVEEHPGFANAKRARELIENPLRARKNLAPEVEAVTLDGERISTADLRGKVVLIDFWGTWCAPCRESVPSLRLLHHKMEGDPFVMISVSNDSDQEALEEFIAKNEMTWHQVWDHEARILRDFGIRSFPTYFLIDHEGGIVLRDSGWSPRFEREILRHVSRAVKTANKDAEDGS